MTGTLARISIALIENGQRLRGVDEEHVTALMNSIGVVGLLNPITVYPRKPFHGGNGVDRYGLVAGLHRKTAYERLGFAEIAATILDLSDLERQIAECDENLCAPRLSASERARFTKRRKEAYEALHPETRIGRNQHGPRDGQVVQPSFADDQAAATGVDARTVRRDAERGERVIDEVMDLVRGTSLDTGTYLDKLKRMPPNDQVHAAKRDLAFERGNDRKSVREALPQSIKDMEAAKAGRSKRAVLLVNPEVRLSELEEENVALKDDNARLIAQVEFFGAMKLQWEQGGYDKVVAGKDEQIRTLKSRVERESADKVAWKRKADFFKGEAEKRGYSKDTIIPLTDGVAHG